MRWLIRLVFAFGLLFYLSSFHLSLAQSINQPNERPIYQSVDRLVNQSTYLFSHFIDENPLPTPLASDGGTTIGGGEIAGIVVGSVGFLALLAIAFSLYVRHYRQNKVIDSDTEDIEQQPADAAKSTSDVINQSKYDGHNTTDDDDMVSDSPHRSRSRSYSSSTYSSSDSSNHSSHAKDIGIVDLCVEISDDESPSTPSRQSINQIPPLSVVTKDSVSPLPSPRQLGYSSHPVNQSNNQSVSHSSMMSSSCGSMSSSSASATLFSPSFASPYASSSPPTHQYFSHSINQSISHAMSPSSPNTLTIHEAKFDQDFDDAEQDELERERQLRSLFQSLRIDDWHMRSFLSNGIGVNELTQLSPAELAQFIPSLRPRRFLLQYINERNGVAANSHNEQVIQRNVAFDTGRYRQPSSSPTASTTSVTFTPWSQIVSTRLVPFNHRTRAASVTLAPVTTSVSVTDALASQSGAHTPISTGQSGSEAITHASHSTFELNSPTMFSTSSRTNYAQLAEFPDSQLVRTTSISISQRASLNDRSNRPNLTSSSSHSQIRSNMSRAGQIHQSNNQTIDQSINQSINRPVSRPRSAHQSVTTAGRSQREFEPSMIHASQVFSILSQHRYYDQTEESQFEYSVNESQHEDDEKDS